jgi:hypothetical protein
MLPMTWRSWLVLALAFGLAVGLAYWLRFALVENEAVVLSCAERGEQLRCLVRETAIFTFHHLALGGLALAGGVLALAWSRLWTLLLALVPAAFGLVLYNVELAAGGVMLALFAIARMPARAARQRVPG